MHLILSWWFG